jgi:hypothetical protein
MPLSFLAPALAPGAAKVFFRSLVGSVKFWLVFVVIAALVVFALKVRHDLLEQGRVQGRAESAKAIEKLTSQVKADGDGFRKLKAVFDRITDSARAYQAEQDAAFKRGKSAGAADERAQQLVRDRDAAFQERLKRAARRSDRCKLLSELDLTEQLQECGLR